MHWRWTLTFQRTTPGVFPRQQRLVVQHLAGSLPYASCMGETCTQRSEARFQSVRTTLLTTRLEQCAMIDSSDDFRLRANVLWRRLGCQQRGWNFHSAVVFRGCTGSMLVEDGQLTASFTPNGHSSCRCAKRRQKAVATAPEHGISSGGGHTRRWRALEHDDCAPAANGPRSDPTITIAVSKHQNCIDIVLLPRHSAEQYGVRNL